MICLQVCHAPEEIDSSDTKPINPFSIENILKSEPPSPPSCSDSGDELSDNSESNPPSNHVLVTPHVAFLLYQSQLQNYWHYLLVNNLAQSQGKTANNKSQTFKNVILPGTYVPPVVKTDDKTVFSVKSPLRGKIYSQILKCYIISTNNGTALHQITVMLFCTLTCYLINAQQYLQYVQVALHYVPAPVLHIILYFTDINVLSSLSLFASGTKRHDVITPSTEKKMKLDRKYSQCFLMHLLS